VVWPIITVPGLRLPERIEAGVAISARLWWFGVVPSWTHRLRVVSLSLNEIRTVESGGPVRVWNHRLIFRPLPDGGCAYTDEIELDGGPRGWGARLFARVMFRYRHRRWRALARVLASTDFSGSAMNSIDSSRRPL
jgi:ligand-binding SRPBCC domain-containing protein